MPKMSIDARGVARVRQALHGPTMGSRWSVLLDVPGDFDLVSLQAALQAAVDQVDQHMSTWQEDSALMQLNRAAVGVWHTLPDDLAQVLDLGLKIGRASSGAFDIALGNATRAWGFGAPAADAAAIRAALQCPRRAAHTLLELRAGQVRKNAALSLDLNGIAKGYGVDRLTATLRVFGVQAALVSIDGELAAIGLQANGAPWHIAIEAPERDIRAPFAMLDLQDAAVATSGDYRHYVQVQGQVLSHTMDPARGGPLQAAPASVTVVAPTCAEADAWATALMVAGPQRGMLLAQQYGLSALFILRQADGGLRSVGCGALFT